MRGKRLLAAVIGVSVVLVPVLVVWALHTVRGAREVRGANETIDLWFQAVIAADYAAAGRYDVAGETGARARAQAITDRVGAINLYGALPECYPASKEDHPGLLWGVAGEKGSAEVIVRYRRASGTVKITSVSMGME